VETITITTTIPPPPTAMATEPTTQDPLLMIKDLPTATWDTIITLVHHFLPKPSIKMAMVHPRRLLLPCHMLPCQIIWEAMSRIIPVTKQTLQVLITIKEDMTTILDKNVALDNVANERIKCTTLSLRNESNVKDHAVHCLSVTSSMRLIVKTFAECLRNTERSKHFSI